MQRGVEVFTPHINTHIVTKMNNIPKLREWSVRMGKGGSNGYTRMRAVRVVE